MVKLLTLEAASDHDMIPSSSSPSDPFIESTSTYNETETSMSKPLEPKTLSELTSEVSNWTLHSDHLLHAFLKRYSTDLFARTKHLETCVRNIAAEADSAHVRLKNTFNQFLLLSNNQFMENRVYDEEQEEFFTFENNMTISEKQEVEKHPEKDKLETDEPIASDKRVEAAAESIVTKYRAALDMGLEAMKLFVMMDDEEEEKSERLSQFETVLDIYNERPLPFIIGTREFLEDETLGLGAAPEEDSDSVSGSSYTSSYSSSDSDSKSESSQTSREIKKRSHSRYRSSSEDSEGSFVAEQPSRQRADSDESDTNGLITHRSPVVEPLRRRTNSDESDTSGLFGRPVAPEKLASSQSRVSMSRDSRRRPVFEGGEEASDDSDWTSDSDDGGKKTPTHKQGSVSRRNQEAPPPFATPSHARKNRFLDSSDEESDAGLFGSAPTTKPRVFATDEAEKLKKRSAVQSSTGGNASTTMQQNVSKRLNSRRSDSFGSSSSDEERGLFGSTSKKKSPTAKAQQHGFRLPPMSETTSRRTNELESKKSFASSDSDAESTISGLFGRPSGAVKDTKKTTVGVPVLPASQQSRRLDFSDDSSDDDDDDGGLFVAAPAKPVTSVAQPVIAPPRHLPFSDSSSDDDEDSGALFGAAPKFAPRITTASPISAPRSQPVQRAPPSGLFGEGDSNANYDSDDGGLFGANKAVATTVPPVVATRPSPVAARDVSDSDDDDDGGLFGVPQSTKSKATTSIAAAPTQTRQSRVHSDSSESDEGGLFGAPSSRSAPTPKPTPTPAPIPATVTSSMPPANPLVHQQDSSDDDSDWSDDDGGLFGVTTSKPTPVKPTAAPVPAVRSTPDPAPTPAAAPVGSLFKSPAGVSAPIVHPPIPSAAARLRAAESSDSDSDSDWDDDGGLFGPPKK
ncbi:unnamed protein product [Peronospora farinosa]|uniref:FAM21/CAPZIP domain-containing protein n=1 Tax=Peronospora farinosa TaxID=134698 RepID=A0AAV0SQ03_9STRA|nr:unnamed protein product [Peronospora farinosa]